MDGSDLDVVLISEGNNGTTQAARSTIRNPRGEHGAVTYDGQTRSVISGKSVTAIDTNGAGDIFAGAFLSAYLTQNTYEKAGFFGNEAAGMLVTQFGPRLSHEQYRSLLPLMHS